MVAAWLFWLILFIVVLILTNHGTEGKLTLKLLTAMKRFYQPTTSVLIFFSILATAAILDYYIFIYLKKAFMYLLMDRTDREGLILVCVAIAALFMTGVIMHFLKQDDTK